MDQVRPIKNGLLIKLSSETVQKLQELSPVESAQDETITHYEPAKSQLIKPNEMEQVSTPGDDNVQLDKNGSEPKETEPVTTDSSNAEKQRESTDTKTDTEWGDYAPYVTYEGETAIYTDPTTSTQYTWDTDSWKARTAYTEPQAASRSYSYENDIHVYTEADGSKFFWDEKKKAWFPKVDDDFLAQYQMSYGFIDNVTKDEPKLEVEKKNPDESGSLKRKAAEPPKWFDVSEDKNNTKVYVSNLPDDLTEEEFVNFMQKCGLVMRDPSSQKMKVKLYMDKDNECFKGDALCTYIKIESVDLALKLLDGSDFRGKTISVQRAQFQMKGDYNPALKPKKKKKKELEKIKRMQEKLFDWRPEKATTESAKNERVVIVKNLFDPTDFDKEVQLILDYQQDLREECGKCGEVRKVLLYDRHPEGVAQITMKDPEQASAVVALINDRWFGKRKLSAEIWDGRTKYKIAETEADMSKRVEKWEKFLESSEGDKCEEKALKDSGKKDQENNGTEKDATSKCEETKQADVNETVDVKNTEHKELMNKDVDII